MKLRLHADATATTLGAARILICAIWITRLALSRFSELGHLDPALFHAHGLMALVPAPLIEAFISPTGFASLQWVALGAFVLVALGLRGGRGALVAGALAATVLFGLAKGFGGHVNHRELVLLYLTWALAILPCFDGLALQARRASEDAAVYVASMQLLCGLLLLNYFFVGAARLFVGTPGVFEPALMYDWVASRNLRPNPWDFGVGWMLLQSGVGRFALAIALPISTVIELVAPAALWKSGRIAVGIAVLLAGFHLAIFAIMNIPFLENVGLLLLLIPYTRFVDRGTARPKATPAVAPA